MGLKSFHLVFIVASMALSVLFGVWSFHAYSDLDSIGYLLTGLGAFSAAGGLVLYLAWFLAKTRKLSYFVLALALFGAEAARACAVCVGNPSSPLVISANAGVLFLMVVVGGVLAGFASLFLFWARRSRQLPPSQVGIVARH